MIKSGSPVHFLLEYGLLFAGSLVIALSFNLFLNPNRIASGGVAGISTIVEAVWGIQPALTQWALNIPLFLLGVVLLGGKFGVKTAVGSVILPFLVLITSHIEPPTKDVLLASIYGGIGIGVGLGLVFRGRGSTGGLDLAAQILHKYTGVSLGLAIALLDGMVILTAGIVFSPANALYAMIGLFVTSKTIDVVQLGLSTSKVAYIITEKTEEMSAAVLYDLDRGLTRLSGQGGYTGDVRPVLMVVISNREVSKIKSVVRSVDPRAFMILSDAAEVFGEGFKLHV
ncbi:YitT family protein [Paenibacillaceae bacterium T2]|uniref:YitT family protein n=1 Tax=Ferviditalea candida TaxID=3108399 RepID=A0ABU5ZIM8_9BACL|nr:YitT family protein [Paenibacillaceae bacterium T2]